MTDHTPDPEHDDTTRPTGASAQAVDFGDIFDLFFGSGVFSPEIADSFFSTAAEQSGPRTTMPKAPIRRRGRGKAQATIALGRAAREILKITPYAMTLRQLYYALVSAGVIGKTESDYTRLKRVMKDMREDGAVPWSWLVDNTRSVHQARTFAGIEGLLKDSAKIYRADPMRQQKVAIQVWAKSDSIGSVIAQRTDTYCIPTFIGRGYSARGYLWDAATDAVAAWASGLTAESPAGKEVHILHVGDHDPSGVDIFRDVEETLRLYCAAVAGQRSVSDVRAEIIGDIRDEGMEPDDVRFWDEDDPDVTEWMCALRADTEWLHVERIALTSDQVDDYELPVRPSKTSDARTAKFTGRGSVEVEALPVDDLLGIVEAAILERIDVAALEIAKTAEQSEREIAQKIAGTPIERLVSA